jgi:hypothetical protein
MRMSPKPESLQPDHLTASAELGVSATIGLNFSDDSILDSTLPNLRIPHRPGRAIVIFPSPISRIFQTSLRAKRSARASTVAIPCATGSNRRARETRRSTSASTPWPRCMPAPCPGKVSCAPRRPIRRRDRHHLRRAVAWPPRSFVTAARAGKRFQAPAHSEYT